MKYSIHLSRGQADQCGVVGTSSGCPQNVASCRAHVRDGAHSDLPVGGDNRRFGDEFGERFSCRTLDRETRDSGRWMGGDLIFGDRDAAANYQSSIGETIWIGWLHRVSE